MGYHYTSNDLYLLAEQVFSDLTKECTSPIAPQCVVTANAQTAEWLKTHFLSTHPDSAILGTQFLPISSFLSAFFNFLQEKKLSHQLSPTVESIYLSIFSLLLEVQQHQIPSDLYQILKGFNHSSNIYNNSKVVSFSFSIAQLFMNYLQLGVDISQLTQANTQYPDTLQWQQYLWNQLFKGKKAPFVNFFQETDITAENDLGFDSLHFFDIDLLPLYMRTLLKQHRNKTPIYFYQFSPSFQFWNDLLTDKQRNFLIKKNLNNSLEHIDPELILANSHRLLRNLGKLGRKLNRTYEDIDLELNELYSINSSVLSAPEYQELLRPDIYKVTSSTELSLLNSVQHDILFAHLENTQRREIALDHSISIETSSYAYQEVESLHKQLFDLLSTSNISPDNIIIYITDPKTYLPLIERIFGSTTKMLPYKSINPHKKIESPLVEGLSHLFSCIKNPWETNDLLTLIKNPLVSQNFSISKRDVSSIEKLILNETPYGLSENHLDILLKQDGLEKAALFHKHNSWISIIESWCKTTTLNSKISSQTPHQPVEVTQLSSINKLFSFVSTLEATIIQILSNKGSTLTDWISYIETVIQSLFNPEDVAISEEEYAMLVKRLNYLRSMQKAAPAIELSFDAIAPLIQSILHTPIKQQALFTCQSVKVIPLSLNISLPSQVSCILGLDESRYPRVPERKVLNLARFSDFEQHLPTSIEEDLYQFLKILMATEKKIFLSYTNHCIKTEQPLQPSQPLSELLKNLDESYTINKEEASKSILKHNTYNAYKSPSSTTFNIETLTKESLEQSNELSIRYIQRLLINPLYTYIQETHQVNAFPEYLKANSPIHPTPYIKNIIKSNAGPITSENLIASLVQESFIPEGYSERLYLSRIEEDYSHAQYAWKNFTNTRKLYIIDGSTPSSYSSRHSFLNFRNIETSTPIVTGLIGNISDEGLLLPIKSHKDILKYWANIILYAKSSPSLSLPPYIHCILSHSTYDISSFADKTVYPSMMELIALVRAQATPLSYKYFKLVLEGSNMHEALDLILHEDINFKKWYHLFHLNSIDQKLRDQLHSLISQCLLSPYNLVKKVGTVRV